MLGFLKQSNNTLYCIVGVLFCAVIMIWSATLYKGHSDLRVYFLDIGQGDSIFIDAPGGRQMLIDGGPNASVLRELGKVMPWYDRTIDVVMATHPDKDHIAGLIPVLDRYRVSYLLDPGISSDTSFWNAFSDSEEKEPAATHILARRGMSIHLGNGADFNILFPDRDLKGIADTNTASIVGRLQFGETSFLMTGDSPQKIEQYLVSFNDNELRSDVLKVGHHGSRSSSAESFLESVKPAYAVISDGKDNSYGHPHQEVLDALASVGATVLRTDEKSTIRVSSDGASVSVKN